MGGFDAELYLRLQIEEMLVGARERRHGPWDTPLVEAARALVAVGAISVAKATAVIEDYALIDALRTENGLEHRGPFGPGARPRRRSKPKPLEPRRVVACDGKIESAQGTLHVKHVALTEHSTDIAITWRPNAAARRLRRRGGRGMFMLAGGGGGAPSALVVDDRGTRAGTHFSGGGSEHEWEGHLTTDRPLARDTAWLEIDGTRIELTAEPADWEVSVEPLPDAPQAHRYLRWRLGIRNHFHELDSLDPVVDALLAAGALEAGDPIIDEVAAIHAAMPHHPGMPPGGPAGGRLPAPWRSMLTGAARQNGPEGTIALAAVTPVFDGYSVGVSAVESSPDSFRIEVDVAPGLDSPGPFDLAVEPQRLAWWAADDRDNHYLGQLGSWSGSEDHSSGEVNFWPALHPKATSLRIMPTSQNHRAVITVPLQWVKRGAEDPGTPV